MKYSKGEVFAMEIEKQIMKIGKVKCIECEQYFEKPYEAYITFIDESNYKVIVPLKPNDEDDESDSFKKGHDLVILNLIFQKVLHQLNETCNKYWLTDVKQIDFVLEVLKNKLPFKTTIYNDHWSNLD